jgi:hypothetical protein
MKVVSMTWEEKRSRMLCHRCWLGGKKTLATKMIDNQGSMQIVGYEDVEMKEIRLGICHECLASLHLIKAREREGVAMGDNDELVKELSHICNALTACIENLVRIQYKMMGNVMCDVCQKHLADSECNTCGMNICTTCEIAHTHTPPQT